MINNTNFEILNWERGAGKTATLIKESNNKQIPIIVNSNEHKKYLVQQAKNMDLIIPEPITLTELIMYKGFDTPTDVLVDEFIPIFTRILNTCFYANVVKATCTIEEFTKNN